MNRDKLIEQSSFIQQWKNDMLETIIKIDPLADKDDIMNVMDELLLENIQLPEVEMDNNYTGENRKTNMISIMDWAMERKPLVAGNGTFYKNQYEAINPVAQMLDGFLKERKAIKKEMFKVEDKTSDLYKDLDRGQQNQKILANSYYGASGMNKSAFFSKWSGPRLSVEYRGSLYSNI